jgi:hypothetical protein
MYRDIMVPIALSPERDVAAALSVSCVMPHAACM